MPSEVVNITPRSASPRDRNAAPHCQGQPGVAVRQWPAGSVPVGPSRTSLAELWRVVGNKIGMVIREQRVFSSKLGNE